MIEELIEKLGDLRYYEGVYEDTDFGDFNFVDVVELDQGRWAAYMLTIVERDGKLYGIEWSRGLTEIQENEVYPSKSTVYEVDKIEKVVYSYKKKSS